MEGSTLAWNPPGLGEVSELLVTHHRLAVAGDFTEFGKYLFTDCVWQNCVA